MQLKQEFTYQRSSIDTLIKALNELASTIHSSDGLANAVIAEAAMTIAELREQKEYLEWVLSKLSKRLNVTPTTIDQWRDLKVKGLL